MQELTALDSMAEDILNPSLNFMGDHYEDLGPATRGEMIREVHERGQGTMRFDPAWFLPEQYEGTCARTKDASNPVDVLNNAYEFAAGTFRVILPMEEILGWAPYAAKILAAKQEMKAGGYGSFHRKATALSGFTRFGAFESDRAYVDKGAWLYVDSVVRYLHIDVWGLLALLE